MTTPLWSLPHHDGSEIYVPQPNPRLVTGLAGTADLHAARDGRVILPSDGPAFSMWQISA